MTLIGSLRDRGYVAGDGGSGRLGEERRPALEGCRSGGHGLGEGREVAVVEAAVVDLGGELAEDTRPVSTGRREDDRNLDPALDDLDS